MAMIQLPIPDVNRTVLRPLVLGVVRDLMAWSLIGQDTEIRYAGPLGSLIQPKSTVGVEEGERSKFGSQPAVDLDVSERLVEEEVSVNNVMKNNNPAVFIDDELGVYMRPDTTFHEIKITMRIRHPDLLTAERWRDDLRYRMRSGKLVYDHRTKWYTHMDPIIMATLREIHRLRENVDGYGDSYDAYLADHFSPKIHLITTMEPGGPNEERKNALVHTESITNIRGWFEFPVTPENAQKQDNSKNFETQVDYIIQYDKPTNWVFLYPISVHNQLLSQGFRRKELPGDEKNTVQYRSDMNNALEYFRSGRGVLQKAELEDTLMIPSFDDWIPAFTVTKTRGLWNALTQLEQEAAGGLLLDLQDMDKYQFSYTILEFLKGEAPFINKNFKSVFQLYLYEGDRLLDGTKYLRMDSDLKIYCEQELDFRRVYHLRMAIVTDLSLLDQDAIDRIIKFFPRDPPDPNIVDWPNVILDTVYPGIGSCWGPDNPMTERDMQQLLWVLANKPRGVNNHAITCADIMDPDNQFDDQLVKPRTFSLYGINVHRKDVGMPTDRSV